MPLYEFKCRVCDHVFEYRIGVADPFPTCQECGGEVKKVFHPTPIIFKGSGWHITDYCRKEAPSSGDKATSDSAAPDSPGAETKTDREAPCKAETAASL